MKQEIKDFPNYEIWSDGKVYSKFTNKFLAQRVNKNGYCYLNLYDEKGKHPKKVHRLVAEAFIENPKSLPFVNHKDENRANNCVNNLEWCDVKYNNNYGTRIHKVKQKLGKCIQMLDLYGNVIKEFESIHDANKYLNKNVNTGNISSCCLGNRNTAYGYRWKYK